MPKAIIYVRVSDARQVENTSLDGQEKVCREWCHSNGTREPLRRRLIFWGQGVGMEDARVWWV